MARVRPQPELVGSVPQPPSVGGPPLPAPAAPRGAYGYKDPPRYPVILAYEGRLKDGYRRSLRQMNHALGRKMASFILAAQPES